MEDFEDQDQDLDLDEEEAGWLADKMHILHMAIYCNPLSFCPYLIRAKLGFSFSFRRRKNR